MKKSLTLPSSGINYFVGLRGEKDEPIYTYNDDYMRYFVRKNMKNGRCTAINQYYKSIISDELFSFISTELNFIGKVCKNLDKYFEYMNNKRECRQEIIYLNFFAKKLRYLISCRHSILFVSKRWRQFRNLEISILISFTRKNLFPRRASVTHRVRISWKERKLFECFISWKGKVKLNGYFISWKGKGELNELFIKGIEKLHWIRIPS